MSKLEYLDENYKLHVIDGENEGVPDGWILVPEEAEVYSEFADRKIFLKFNEEIVFGYIKDVFEILPIWSKKEIVVDRKSRILWIRKMKEYLVERDGKYELVEAYHLDGGIEVPEGADEYKSNGKFYRDNGKCFYSVLECWNLSTAYSNYKNLWQRKPSLNDQYAEIEEVRQTDNVNNPEHYNKGGVECIDAIESSMTKEAFAGYLKGNIQKYMWRYENKGGAESLKKAQWYLNKLVNLIEGSK